MLKREDGWCESLYPVSEGSFGAVRLKESKRERWPRYGQEAHGLWPCVKIGGTTIASAFVLLDEALDLVLGGLS